MPSDLAISIRGLGKSYEIEHKPQTSSLSEAFLSRLRNPRGKTLAETIWALKDVSFDISQGDVVGIVGRNGAGKSTLFKLISRIVAPTTGEIRLTGRVASLIEVGTGFQPELTGRENIFLNGAILGMRRKEIRQRFDEIVDFSGVEKFLDTPVKRYSSGMYVRLAFAVAAHLDADILLVDEVLAVGDSEFQKKCLGKMETVARSGRTVFLVSHDTTSIKRLCTKGIFLNRGELVQVGPVDETLRLYLQSMKAPQKEISTDLSSIYKYLKSFDLVDELGVSTRDIFMGSALRVRITAEFPTHVAMPYFMIFIDNANGQRMLNVISPRSDGAIKSVHGIHEITCTVGQVLLAPGEYSIRLAITASDRCLLDTDVIASFVVHNADPFGNGWGGGTAACVTDSRWSVSREVLAVDLPEGG
jgi:lipopolysaccharide transport system ATP-binding protein